MSRSTRALALAVGGLLLAAFPAKAQIPFFATNLFPCGDGPVALATADFDGNGKRDVAVVNTSANTVSVFLGPGNALFLDRQDLAVGTLPVAVAAGDFDFDGHADLAVVNKTSATVSILLGVGDGTFATPAPTYATAASPQGIVAEDLDGDGDLDLACPGNNGVSVLKGAGDGTFGTYTF
jgi:hypothetical protein